MSGDVYPQIRKQSHAEANAEYDHALDWLRSLLGQAGRFQNYKATFSRVFQRVLGNQQPSIPESISPSKYVEMRFEAHALVNIWRQFRSDTSQRLIEKLTIVVRGAALTSSEGEKTEPRDILFELETAALLKGWGLPVHLGQSADLGFKFKDFPVLCECKRLQTPRAFLRNLKLANSQLRNALNAVDCPDNALGMIAIDISRIAHLDAEGLERYPQTRYGETVLPSNMVVVPNELQFEPVINQRLNSFISLHRQIFDRDFFPGVASCMLCYNIPAVDLYGTGRTHVLSIQRISPLKSATSAERKYFEGFHADMMKNYRRGRSI